MTDLLYILSIIFLSAIGLITAFVLITYRLLTTPEQREKARKEAKRMTDERNAKFPPAPSRPCLPSNGFGTHPY